MYAFNSLQKITIDISIFDCNKFYRQTNLIQFIKPMSFDRIQAEDLLQIIEIICSNIGYPRLIEQEMLIDYSTYFGICEHIFQELRIKIIKIHENKKLNSGQKLQQLIDLLSQELDIDDFDISGQEIVNSNGEHIHRFLQILYEYSKIYMDSKKPTNAVKSAPVKNKIMKQKDNDADYRSSAREPRRVENYNQEEENHDASAPNENKQESQQEDSYLIRQKAKKRKPVYSANAKRARSQQQTKKNLHLEVVHKIMGEKTKMLRAASRENRKSRLQSVKLAKNSYKIFLKRYAKENMAAYGKKSVMKQKSAAKPISQQLPQKDFFIIDSFFQSFAYKFRDKKTAYLHRIQKLVHQQELDRFCYQNKLDREMRKYMNDRLQAQLQSQTHQHRVRSYMLRENSKAIDQVGNIVRKDFKMKERQLKKELKMSKKEQLKKIESAMRENNERVLMQLQQGGRLEKVIMEMYKRF